MIYISAQPDEDYFVWQLRVQIANLKSVGFNGEYHILVKMMRDLVNPNFLELQKELEDEHFKFFFFLEERKDWRAYLPSLRPYVLAKHFASHNIGEFFYIDSDIIFRELPDFTQLPNHSWVSDCVSYVGGEYILSKSHNLLKAMCAIVGIDVATVLLRNKHSGGAQYFIRGVDSAFWQKVEKDAINLYLYMTEFNQTYQGHGIQAWTADMWAVLWNLWLTDIECKVHKELDFCWPTQRVKEWDKVKILHNAGVTPDLRNKLFYKADYIRVSPIGQDLSFVDPEYCSIKYVNVIQSL